MLFSFLQRCAFTCSDFHQYVLLDSVQFFPHQDSQFGILCIWANARHVSSPHSIPLPAHVGISTGSPPSSLHQWLSREVNDRLHRALRHRLSAMVSDLHGVLVDVSSDNFLPVIQNPVYSFNLPSSAFRLWGLARWGHDHSSTGHSSHLCRPRLESSSFAGVRRIIRQCAFGLGHCSLGRT